MGVGKGGSEESKTPFFGAMFIHFLYHTVLTKSPLGDRYGFYFYLGKEEKPHLGENIITADQWQNIFIKIDQNTR